MNQRRTNNLRSACSVQVATQSDWLRTQRSAAVCGDVVPSVEVPLSLPADTSEPLETLRTPEPLVVANEEFTLRCADLSGAGPHGDEVILSAGTETEVFQWTSIPDVSETQLHRLAEADVTSKASNGLSAEDMEGILESYQTNYVLTELARLKEVIASSVHASAVAALDCYWLSAQISVRCTDVHSAVNGQFPEVSGVNNPSVVPTGAVQSRLSQADANNMATQMARRALGCLVPNDESTLSCEDLGFSEAVPVDPLEQTERRRIGVVSVPAGVAFAATKAEANEQALAAARAGLDCFFYNEQLEVACAQQAGFEHAYTGEPSSLAEGRVGNPVTVAARSVIMEGDGASTAAANALARSRAGALLRCTFRNTAQTVVCPEAVADGVTLVPRSTAPLVVPAGIYEATSQEEADQLARAMGLLQLQCEYCNPYIPPTCVAPGYVNSPGAVLPPGLVDNRWSIDVTAGLAAGVVCSSDPAQVMPAAQAAAVARLPVKDAGCIYQNDQMWFGCLATLPAGVSPPAGGYHHPSYASNTGLPPGYSELPPLSEQLSPNSLPAPAGDTPWQVLEAGAYQISDVDVPTGVHPKDYANERARLYGLALLDCKFGNPQMTVTCESAYGRDRFDQSIIAQGQGQSVSVDMPRAAYESVVSFKDAVEAALAAARISLDCYYENDELRVSCWQDFGVTPPPKISEVNKVQHYGTGKVRRTWVVGSQLYTDEVDLKAYHLGSLALPLRVPAGSYRSLVSKTEANALALNSAIGALDCAAQARDVTECNDPMIARCGGTVEPNPTSPLQTSTNAIVESAWSVDDNGVVQAGDGHNYVVSQDEGGEWQPLDLGPSTDPVGGITTGVLGPGILIPGCSFRAGTKEEANRMAYLMGRAMLSCTSETAIPELGGGGAGGGGGGGADGAQTGCKAECIAIYA